MGVHVGPEYAQLGLNSPNDSNSAPGYKFPEPKRYHACSKNGVQHLTAKDLIKDAQCNAKIACSHGKLLSGSGGSILTMSGILSLPDNILMIIFRAKHHKNQSFCKWGLNWWPRLTPP
jgi:hypothetical protein